MKAVPDLIAAAKALESELQDHFKDATDKKLNTAFVGNALRGATSMVRQLSAHADALANPKPPKK